MSQAGTVCVDIQGKGDKVVRIHRLIAGWLLLLLMLDGGVRAEEEPLQQLVALIEQYPVTVLGERHKHRESPELVTALVDAVTGAGRCLALALEISSDEQAILDAAMRGELPVSAIEVHPIIDHPAFRTLLQELSDFTQSGRCLVVEAADAPVSADIRRDEWLARILQRLAGKRRVLALMGNLHALKRVEWISGTDNPFLAERLVRRGLGVVSVLQEWAGKCAAPTASWLPIEHPRAIAAARHTLSLAAVHEPRDIGEVVDGIILWRCTRG